MKVPYSYIELKSIGKGIREKGKMRVHFALKLEVAFNAFLKMWNCQNIVNVRSRHVTFHNTS